MLIMALVKYVLSYKPVFSTADFGWAQEETLEIEYIESVMPPQRMSDIPHDDWVSTVLCQPPRCV